MVTGIGNFFLAAAPIHPGRDRATPTTPFEIDGATQVWHSSARYAQFRAPAAVLLSNLEKQRFESLVVSAAARPRSRL
jgi:hypothetical protein